MHKKGNTKTKPIDKSRRNFFRQFLAETVSLAEEIQGKPQMRLNELDQVPDDVIRNIIPVFNKSCPCRIEGDQLIVKNKKTGLSETIYRLNPREVFIVSCFDGTHTVGDIRRYLEERFGEETEAAYEQVKSLFIALAKRMICHPAQAHG